MKKRIAVGGASLVLVFALLGLGWTVFAAAPQNNHGNQPDDVVRNFIKLVLANDYKSAEQLWYGDSKLVAVLSDGSTHDGRIPFKDFCAYYKNIDLKTVKISKARRGKSGFSMVYIDWEENGQKKHHQFGLKTIDGQWKMERGYYW